MAQGGKVGFLLGRELVAPWQRLMMLLAAVVALLTAAATATDIFDAAAPASEPVLDPVPLYEAYNQLHALSQQLQVGQIDSPTVVVVGRQTDGKSALIEALMGFQFNHVGGGTKTRRPIALQMQYHPDREQPSCFLHTVDGERALSLEELQAHIERENQRLERLGQFAAEEIVARIEYKYCPNLSIVDTPGLLSTAAEAAEGAGVSSQAHDVEGLVLSKISSSEALILCIEETNNWDVAATRAFVCRADPGLTRTVVVSSKLDTKFAQFGSAGELRNFLSATPLHHRHPELLGGPFFTSVPAGRVGSTAGHHFSTHRGFLNALNQQEAADVQYIQAVLPGHVVKGSDGASAIGVSRLKTHLEARLRDRYLASLVNVVPQLQQTDAGLVEELTSVEAALHDLDAFHAQAAIKESVGLFVRRFELAVHGVASAEARVLGQSLDAEVAGSGVCFDAKQPGVKGSGLTVKAATAAPAGSGVRSAGSQHEQALPGLTVVSQGSAGAKQGPQSPHKTEAGQPVAAGTVPDGPTVDGEARLFGGAQYYRLMAAFRMAVATLPPVVLDDEDITNAMGLAVDDIYVGRSASALALRRSLDQFKPLLAALFDRLRYVLTRMLLFVAPVFTRDEASSHPSSHAFAPLFMRDEARQEPSQGETPSHPHGFTPLPSRPAPPGAEGMGARISAAIPTATSAGVTSADTGMDSAFSRTRSVPSSKSKYTPSTLTALVGPEKLWATLSEAFHEHLSESVARCHAECIDALGAPGILALMGLPPPHVPNRRVQAPGGMGGLWGLGNGPQGGRGPGGLRVVGGRRSATSAARKAKDGGGGSSSSGSSSSSSGGSGGSGSSSSSSTWAAAEGELGGESIEAFIAYTVLAWRQTAVEVVGRKVHASLLLH